MTDIISVERIEDKIYLIRGLKVMLDKDLARLYGVKTHVLNQAVKRNIERFPDDFMFKLNNNEAKNLISQVVISSLPVGKAGWGGRRKLPYVFTEQGIAMLSSVLRSERAIQVNIAIMRAFVKLRHILSTHKDLAQKLVQLEKKVGKHDAEINVVFEVIKKMIAAPVKPKGKIGFIADKGDR